MCPLVVALVKIPKTPRHQSNNEYLAEVFCSGRHSNLGDKIAQRGTFIKSSRISNASLMLLRLLTHVVSGEIDVSSVAWSISPDFTCIHMIGKFPAPEAVPAVRRRFPTSAG